MCTHTTTEITYAPTGRNSVEGLEVCQDCWQVRAVVDRGGVTRPVAGDRGEWADQDDED